MDRLSAVISCLLVTVAAVTAQKAQSRMDERLLPQWLTGIIALSGFLFLAFVSFLVKKAWCDKPSRRKTILDSESVRENDFVMTNGHTCETSLNMPRSKEGQNVYNNLVIDTEEKMTAM